MDKGFAKSNSLSLTKRIPFNQPTIVGKELEYIQQAIARRHLSGNGPFTQGCQVWLEKKVGCARALLTHSCTAALEMAAILTNVGVGDEIIMPSYTFPSTANAFVMRGGIPVFIDIRPDTLNIDETKIEAAVTKRTKAIVVVHYAGVPCEMDAILAIAQRYKIPVIEDAAQGLISTYKDKPVGSFGSYAATSFHETKNMISGEGGALLINDPAHIERAEIVWEKGTNRSQFLRGEVSHYTWLDVGSSYLPSEVMAAFLLAQLEEADSITRRRLKIWEQYHEFFKELEVQGRIRRPIIPPQCQHNGHLYYLLIPQGKDRQVILQRLKNAGVDALSHYRPLHSSPAGRKYGKVHGLLPVTEEMSQRLIRLPLWLGMTHGQVQEVGAAILM